VKRAIAVFLLAMMATFSASAAQKKPATPPAPALPAFFTLPPSIGIAGGGEGVVFEVFGESDFWEGPSGGETSVTKQGKHWRAPLELKHPPADIDGKGVWAAIKPSLIAGGWTIPQEYDSNPFSAMMRYDRDGRDVWGYIKIFGPDDIRLNLVDVSKAEMTFVIPPPGPTIEKFVAGKVDFPYLPPLPGTATGTGGAHSGAMVVLLPGAEQEQVVAPDSATRFYPIFPGLSTLAFVESYQGTMAKAGWTIVEANHGSDATVTGHYARNGRDVWAYLHMGGEEYSLRVGDAGAENDIARQFARDCHVALYGVLFDFNKATLKPESEGVLQRVLAFARSDASLKLEVQGHTDNVGGEDYNQMLSEARAKSVVAWATEHGVAANRLSFKGYGKTLPVASNDSDEGRARNRRVEIARPGCTKLP
jgi:OmpA-OmpF porin, OOP family